LRDQLLLSRMADVDLNPVRVASPSSAANQISLRSSGGYRSSDIFPSASITKLISLLGGAPRFVIVTDHSQP
jgi:hypothetical protein